MKSNSYTIDTIKYRLWHTMDILKKDGVKYKDYNFDFTIPLKFENTDDIAKYVIKDVFKFDNLELCNNCSGKLYYVSDDKTWLYTGTVVYTKTLKQVEEKIRNDMIWNKIFPKEDVSTIDIIVNFSYNKEVEI